MFIIHIAPPQDIMHTLLNIKSTNIHLILLRKPIARFLQHVLQVLSKVLEVDLLGVHLRVVQLKPSIDNSRRAADVFRDDGVLWRLQALGLRAVGG